ncbi:hypothetical protein Tco_0343417 [Tanacetum coccineum]
MSNMLEDIQYAGSDTRLPMLDRTDFESWQQRIRLYCLGKDNGENIMKSITEGGLMPQFSSIQHNEWANIHLPSISNEHLLLKTSTGLKVSGFKEGPVDDTMMNKPCRPHSDTNARGNVCSWECLRSEHSGKNTDSITDNIATYASQDNGAVLDRRTFVVFDAGVNMSPTLDDMWLIPLEKTMVHVKSYIKDPNYDEVMATYDSKTSVERETLEIAELTRKRMYEKMKSPQCIQNKVKFAPPDYSKENYLAIFAPQRDLTPEQIFWAKDENDRKKVEASVLKPLSTPTVSQKGKEVLNKQKDTEVIPFFKTLKQHIEGVQKALFKEVKEMEEIFDQMSAEVDQNTVDKQCAKIERKNLLIANENLIANIQKDVNDEMIRGFNKLEVEYLNLQLKYQHLQENFGNNKSQTSQDVPEFDSFFRIKNLETQLQEKDNVIRNLKAQVSKMNDRSCETYNAKDVTALIEQNECVRVELEKVKQHYKELYDSIKITRAHTSEKTSTMLNEIESLKAQLKSKVSCVTSDSVKPKVLAPGMYAIDVKPIPHPLKNNRSAHLNYINHLKESVETVREIVEEARVVKPLDNALNYACQYTKLSQELLEYVIGTCPKSFNERDNKAPSTPLTRKKQVTFNDKPETSTSNTQKHVVQQKVQQTNVPVIHSTGVNTSTEASGSKPSCNTKKNRILPAKSENKKKVEDHPRIQ